MWNPLEFFTTDRHSAAAAAAAATAQLQTPPSVPSQARNTQSLGNTGLLLLACSRVKRRVVRLSRRIQVRTRTNLYILAGLACTAAIGYGCSKRWWWSGEPCCIQIPLVATCGRWLKWVWPLAALRSRKGDMVGDEREGMTLGTSGRCLVPHCKGSSSALADGEDEDNITFADATESAFRMFQRRVERTYMAPLLRVLDELETLGERWQSRVSRHASEAADANRDAGGGGGGGGDDDDVAERVVAEGEEDTLHERVLQKAIEADELLTQLIVQFDLAPVGNSVALRRERKASIIATSFLADRIAKWMHLPPRSHRQEEAVTEEKQKEVQQEERQRQQQQVMV